MKKNSRGFVLIETIITVVVLSTSLLYLYSSYSNIIDREETRLYYDDIAYIYRTNYVKRFLNNYSNINNITDYFKDTYILTIGPSFDNMFTEEQLANNMLSSMENMFNSFNINQIVLLDANMLNDCNGSDSDSVKCNSSTKSLSYSLNNYINSLNSTEYNYYLVVEYAETLKDTKITKCIPGNNNSCNLYYVALGL